MFKPSYGITSLLAVGLSAVTLPAAAIDDCEADCCGRIVAVEVSGITDFDARALITCADGEPMFNGHQSLDPAPVPMSVSCYTKSSKMIDLATLALDAPRGVALNYSSKWRSSWCTSLELSDFQSR